MRSGAQSRDSQISEWLAADVENDLSEILRSMAANAALHAAPESEVAVIADDDSLTEALIRNQLAQCLEGDYFQILGVDRRATRDDVLRAHVSLATTFSDAALSASLVRRFASELCEIREALAEATRLLTSDRLRLHYRAHL